MGDSSITFANTISSSKKLETLFLCTLFLYPFSAADHTLYIIPQILLLGTGLILLPQSAVSNATLMKLAACGLAIVSSSTAILREALADKSEFLEPVKLLINLSTVLLFLFLGPVFDSLTCAKWLKRFAMIWLLIVIVAYVYSRASMWQLLALLLEPEGVTSTRLYELAEPLAPIFLTKNIMAMYIVAIFGVFLYFCRRAAVHVTLLEKATFFVLIVLFFSRQAILSAVLLIALDYFLAREKRVGRWALVVVLVTALLVGGFLSFAFDFTSQEDGATARLELWRDFLAHWNRYAFAGLGVHQLNASLEHLDIDNYHMFFMNQIAAYGIIHCLAFNLLLTLIALWSLPKTIRWLLIAPYWLNVCFQTYGYEYGNLLLFCVAANSVNLRFNPTPQDSAYVFSD
jgi:hypothetical protein